MLTFSLKPHEKTVVAIGKFDGVHQGHKELLITASDLAAKSGLVSVGFVITNSRSNILTSSAKREQIIKSFGIEKVVIQDLSPDFMNMSATEFVDKILIKNLCCAHVVVGYNFRFAKGRSADASVLETICRNKGISCTVIPEVVCHTSIGTLTASSTNVRDCLSKGDVKTASELLGRPYSISGEVVSGKKLGRTLDFPTANIDVSCRFLLPKNGVYATKTHVNNKTYLSVTNIGDNPTVNEKGNITVETNILRFSGNIYGKNICVEFIERIRDEKKFDSLDELKAQIHKDAEFVQNRLL